MAQINAAELGIEVRLGSPLSAEDLNSELEGAFEEVTSFAGVDSASGWVDGDARTIFISYTLKDQSRQSVVDENEIRGEIQQKCPQRPKGLSM